MVHRLILLFLLLSSFSQEPASGIYIIHNPPKKTSCEKELKMIIGKTKVCISKKPIIPIEEIEYATDIQYDPNFKTYYIDVGISSVGIQTLNKTVNSLTDIKFALVIQDDVICIFSIEQEIQIRSIRIGEDVALKDLTIVRAALEKVKF